MFSSVKKRLALNLRQAWNTIIFKRPKLELKRILRTHKALHYTPEKQYEGNNMALTKINKISRAITQGKFNAIRFVERNKYKHLFSKCDRLSYKSGVCYII